MKNGSVELVICRQCSSFQYYSS